MPRNSEYYSPWEIEEATLAVVPKIRAVINVEEEPVLAVVGS
jgi:hypothetical protein